MVLSYDGNMMASIKSSVLAPELLHLPVNHSRPVAEAKRLALGARVAKQGASC